MAAVDRCAHRSTRLSIGWIEGDSSAARTTVGGTRRRGSASRSRRLPTVRCPSQRCVETFEAAVAYDLVWVRIDRTADTEDPRAPGVGRRRRCGWSRARPTRGRRRRCGGSRTSSTSRTSPGCTTARSGAATNRCRRARHRTRRRRAAVPLRPTRDAGRARGAVRPFAVPHADAVHGRHRVPSRHRCAAPPLDDRVAARRALVPLVLVHLARRRSRRRRRAASRVPTDRPRRGRARRVQSGSAGDGARTRLRASVRTDRVSIEYRRWLCELAESRS